LFLNTQVKKTVSGTVREHEGAVKIRVPEYVESMFVLLQKIKRDLLDFVL